jgi:hypothetical protein
MIRIIKSLIIIIFFSAITIQANSETSWITKKSDKSKTDTKKVVKETKSNNWIKKKEVKENKKKLKEKIKESKSWITKKSKKKLKDIKNNLKKHKNIDQLPKAEFYFTAIITGKNDQEDRYVYGYVNSNKKSDLINFNNKSFYSVSDGIAYFENKNNSCVVDSLLTPMRSQLSGDVVIKCKKNLKMTGGFLQIGDVGKGIGETSEGNNIEFEFYTSKDKAIAKLDDYKNKEIRLAHSSFSSNNSIDLKPTGKYYALLIGNSKYANWASLTSPVNDVNEIETLLTKKYNFEKVIIIQNGTREKIFDAFDQLSQITTDNDYVLVYYSGHGDQKGNKSYWIPTNAKKKYSSKWINIKDIENYLEEIPAHHLAIMVDSCYFTGFKGSNKIDEKKSKHYKKFLNKRARIVLASGQNEPVSDTGAGNNSVFGKTLIQALKNSEGAISLGEIGLSIGYAHANMDQMPIYATYNHWGHGGGDFVFIPKKK